MEEATQIRLQDQRPPFAMETTESITKLAVSHPVLALQSTPHSSQEANVVTHFRIDTEGLSFGRLSKRYIMSRKDGTFLLTAKTCKGRYSLHSSKYDMGEQYIQGWLNKSTKADVQQYVLLKRGEKQLEASSLQILSSPKCSFAYLRLQKSGMQNFELPLSQTSNCGVLTLRTMAQQGVLLRAINAQNETELTILRAKDGIYQGSFSDSLSVSQAMAIALFGIDMK